MKSESCSCTSVKQILLVFDLALGEVGHALHSEPVEVAAVLDGNLWQGSGVDVSLKM